MFSILGATGSIGASLAHSLESMGTEVYRPVKTDPALYERELGDVVYSIGLTADFRSRPFETLDAHVGVLRTVLERATFSSFLYLSSARVYRGLEFGREDTPLVIDPTNPDDLYNASKVVGEALCLSLPNDAIRVVRLSNVVGPGATSPSFVRSLVVDAVDRGVIELETDLESVKNYVDIRDVVDLIPRIATAGRSRLYNVAGGAQTAHREIVALLQRATGCDVSTRPGLPVTTFPPISIERAQQEFDFAPRGIAESLDDMVSAYRAAAIR